MTDGPVRILEIPENELTAEQKKALKDWISQGADFGGFKAPAYTNPKARK